MKNKDTYLIVDADSLVYSAVTCKKDESKDGYVHDTGVAIEKFDNSFQEIINLLWENNGINVTHFCFIIGGSDNFRKILSPSYKANRPPSPPLRGFLSSYIESEYNAYRAHSSEADDVIVATHKKLIAEGKDVVIAANDKDIKQIPCKFFDYFYQRKMLVVVDEKEARYNFYGQLLIGDKTDNINGIEGYGKAKPPKLFKGCVSDYSYLRVCFTEYKKKYKQKAREKLIETYTLVKLRDNVETPTEINFNEI